MDTKQHGVKKMVYALLGRDHFEKRIYISKFVSDKGFMPVYPNMLVDFHLNDQKITDNKIIMRCSEVWVFGSVDSKMQDDINLAKKIGKPVKYFEPDTSVNAANFREKTK